jgi:hypothetical protein
LKESVDCLSWRLRLRRSGDAEERGAVAMATRANENAELKIKLD